MNPQYRRPLLMAGGVIGLLLVMAVMAGLFNKRIEPGLNDVRRAEQIDAADIHTVSSSRDIRHESIPASITAAQTTMISSRILGRIKSIPVTAGQRVSAGDLLVHLESSDLESRVAETEELTKVVVARLDEAKLQLARFEELLQKKMVSQSELDKARSSHDALVAEFASAQHAREQAQATLAYSRIVAPISGRVVDRFADAGDLASPGQKLVSIYNPEFMRVEAQVHEQLALSLQLEQAVEVAIPSLDQRLPAVIAELVPAADPGARSFLVKADIPLSVKILPGMFARLLVPAGEVTRILVPVAMIARVGQLDMVWVIDANQVLERRLVRLGESHGERGVEILAGVTAGDRLVAPAVAATL